MRRSKFKRGRRSNPFLQRRFKSKFRSAVKAVTAITVTKRMRGVAIALAATSTSSYVLIKSNQAPSTSVTTDFGGTNIAQCWDESKIKSIDLHLEFYGLAANTRLEWALMKEEQATSLITNPSDILTNEQPTDTIQDMHKHCLTYGMKQVPGTSLILNVRVAISRKALHRNHEMRSTDQLKLYVNNSGAAANFNGYGRIWVTEP